MSRVRSILKNLFDSSIEYMYLCKFILVFVCSNATPFPLSNVKKMPDLIRYHIQINYLLITTDRFFHPQWKSFYSKEPIVKMENFGNVTLSIGNGFICLECGDDFQEDNHIASLTKCFRCKYQTVCSRAIMEHVSTCIDADDKSKSLPPLLLGQKMFCICGFSSDDGNELANHLAQCDKKSAYDTADAALANTVKCNMLDMLDLMPRDGGEDDDSSDNLLIPADQQQQLLSKSIDGVGKATVDDDDEEMSKGQAPQAIDDFNTQLSLDDLAPASVAPQNEQDDRTPTLSDEYQVRVRLLPSLCLHENPFKFHFIF